VANKALVHPTLRCRACGHPLTTPRIGSGADERLDWDVIHVCYPCMHGLLVRASWTNGDESENRNGDHRGAEARVRGHETRIWAAPEMQKAKVEVVQ